MRLHRWMTLFLTGIGLISATAVAAGSIYKWVDQNGMTQYTQTPPPKNAKSSQTVRVSTHVPVDVREGRPQGMVDAQTLQAYTTPTPASPEQVVNSADAASNGVDEVSAPAGPVPRVIEADASLAQ